MNHQLWALPITFVLWASCLIWFVIGCRGKWWLKLILMAGTGTMCAAEWQSVEDMFGYPKIIKNMDAFGDQEATLYKIVVDEPKAIYLWMKLGDDKDLRAYQIPYTRGMAKQQDVGESGPERIKFSDKVKFGGSGEQKGDG